MTQPEQEAREMLAREYERGVTVHGVLDQGMVPVSIAIKAMCAFAARPTAGIDREAVARLIDPKAFEMAVTASEQPTGSKFGADLCRQSDVRIRDAFAKADAILALLPTPAKTGERGAVIEECARVADAEAAIMLGNEQDKKHSRALQASCRMSRATAEGIARAIRALSQPLPDAPRWGGIEAMTDARAFPDLLSEAEGRELLSRAEQLWSDLQNNNLGGFSGINRPFWIVAEFKAVIEQFGRRDVGLRWSKNDLDAARPTSAQTVSPAPAVLPINGEEGK
jgi:hypothetical protein